MRNCNIIVVASKNDPSLAALDKLPQNAKIIGYGSTIQEIIEDIQDIKLLECVNTVFIASGNKSTLKPVVDSLPNLIWIHSQFAGVDHVLYEELIENNNITVTNAKGVFSSTLAEYVMGVISYVTKDFERLKSQKAEKRWEKFNMIEIKGKTMGIIGYGDIGRKCATLGKAYGLNIIACRRRPELSHDDILIDEVYGIPDIPILFQKCDFVVLALPMTPDTFHIINDNVLQFCKQDQILINIGRGHSIDEIALVNYLKSEYCKLLRVALDVYQIEPLPIESELWNIEKVLISPHNADMTFNSRLQSTNFFCEICNLFINNQDLICVIDKKSGY